MSTGDEFRIGVDVGGTNTDAVVIDSAGNVVRAVKVATTPEPIEGIRQSLDRLLLDVDNSLVAKAMLGTTHPTNAIIQRQGLDTVGVLRLAAPSSLRRAPGRSMARRHPGHGDRRLGDHRRRQRVHRRRDRATG